MAMVDGYTAKTDNKLKRLNASWGFHAFLALSIILLVFAYPPMLFYGDTDTARNYLNTIVSSLSTILALCISIILVAIQLAASNYTHRVLDFYIRLPYNVSLFLVYLVTILHSFYLMAKIRDPLRDPLSYSLREEMSADLVLVMICFVSLLLYMYAVVQLLKPERIIHLILRDYKVASDKNHWRAAQANIEQLCDIAKRAASVSDSVTGTLCMRVMRQIGEKLPMPSKADDSLLSVHQNLVEQWIEMVGVCAKEKETSLMKTVLDGLFDQGHSYIERDFWEAAVIVIKSYRHIVFSHLLAEGQYYYVETVATRMYALAETAAEKGDRGQEFAVRTWDVIRAIGEHVFAMVPETGVTFLHGFLLSDHLRPTLDTLPGTQQVRALSEYFELWKAFVMSAQMRDAARFAVWWEQSFAESNLFEAGQGLAIRIAAHLHKDDVVHTLAYTWRRDEDELLTAIDIERFMRQSPTLFDGWPADSVSAIPVRHGYSPKIAPGP